MRELSDNAKKSSIALNSVDVYLDLITISHEDLADDIRIVKNNENIISQGHEFQAFNFEIVLPQESPDTTPVLELKVGNVDRAISDALLSISSPASVLYQCVLSSDVNEVELQNSDLKLRVATITPLEVSGSLVVDDVLAQAFPKQTYSPTYFSSII